MSSSERDKERERARYAALSPEEKKAYGKRANGRTKAKLERLKTLEIEYRRLYREHNNLRRDIYSGQPLLDVTPFRMWLIGKQREYGDTYALAKIIGQDESRVRMWLQGYVWERPRVEGADYCGPTPVRGVTIDVVDRALQAEGSTTLDQLYPKIHLWDIDNQQGG